ncbi:MAG TPA: DUF4386 family protein [Solirubrobacteraceae bacterium]|nr:DUF4386 family protein [Solirubrobacteraceae bacterium]
MPSKDEISQQLARESHRRARLAVPAFAGGFLFLLSTVIIAVTLNALPRVGLLQGLSPALHGQGAPSVSPSAAPVKGISHHAFTLLVGSALKSLSLVVLVLVLLVLLDATRFRRPETFRPARALVLVGGVALAVLYVVHEAVETIRAHEFAVGHDFSTHAAEQVTGGGVNTAFDAVSLLATIALVVGMIATCVNAIRTGLLTRWMGVIGILAAVLILLPLGGQEPLFEIIPAFWLVAMGVLYMGRWPNGEPPAWAAGEARPWPTQAELRAEREAKRGGARPQPAGAGPATIDGDVAPEPVGPANGSSRSSRKRRGRRGGRR